MGKRKQEEDSENELPSDESVLSDSESSDAGSGGGESESESPQKSAKLVASSSSNRSKKDALIANILCRWWYGMPEWPPANYDYAPVLASKNLRVVPLSKWEDAEEFDAEKRLKCYALSQFPGLYRDANGKLRDLRPKEGKPCYNYLKEKSSQELEALYKKCLVGQFKVLCSLPKPLKSDVEAAKALESQLRSIQNQSSK